MRLIIVFVITVSLFGCVREEDEPCHTAERTIVAYLAGDNDLSDEIGERSMALLRGWKSGDGELLIYADKYKEAPVLLRAEKRGHTSVLDTVVRYSEANSASAHRLRQVISDARRLVPSEKYGLILFSHATGWLPSGAFDEPERWERSGSSLRSLFKDGRQEMELGDFVEAIPHGMFDFIVADMCFMAGIEVAYALRAKVPYLVASAAEILSPGFIPVYPDHLPKLYAETPDLKGFAEAFYTYFEGKKDLFRSATISVIDTQATAEIADLVHALTAQGAEVTPSRFQEYDRKSPHLFYDLGDYLHSLARTPQEHARIDELLGRVVLYKRDTGRLINLLIRRHSGLSIFVPLPTLPRLTQAYEKTAWAMAVRHPR